jgi:cation diffusion facilitator CzcD-associated flavoprotein CzcO
VTDPIERIESRGIVTADRVPHEVDAIVLATGFAVGLARAPFPVVGRDGRSLDDAWRHGAVAYKGMTVILMGPNTGPGHTSVLVYTEAQIAHTLGAIRMIRRHGLRHVDVRQQVQGRYNAGVQGRMKHMAWSSACNSWYLSKDGSNRALYPGLGAEYVVRARRVNASDYERATF